MAALTALGSTAFIGLAVVAHGMTRLSWAEAYRDRTGEGVAFVQVGMQLLAGGAIAIAAAVGIGLVGARLDADNKGAAYGVAGAIVGIVLACAGAAVGMSAPG